MPFSATDRPATFDQELRRSRAFASLAVFVAAYIGLLFLSLLLPDLKLVPSGAAASGDATADPTGLQPLIPYISRLIISATALGCLLWAAYTKPRLRLLNVMTLILVGVMYFEMVGAGFANAYWGEASQEHPLLAVSDAGLLRMVLHHLLPAIVLIWKVRDALIALLPIVIVEAALIAIADRQAPGVRPALHVSLFYLLLLCLPGLLVAWVRQGGVGSRAYREAYADITEEILAARQLHEALFPKPIDDGPVRLDYCYFPMTQLGGDYLHVSAYDDESGEPASLVCTLVDVTGHGLKATLAVNQLHALLQRQQQQPGVPDPGELMAELNRHIHDNCSVHGVYATALCLRLDRADNRLTWCSAGHPPGIIIDHGVCQPGIESTAMMLGALPPEAFDPDPQTMTLNQSAQVLVYSDGAIEKQLAIKKMLGVSGLCMFIGRMLARDKMDCQNLMDSLSTLNAGARQDDILLVRLGFASPGQAEQSLEAQQAESGVAN